MKKSILAFCLILFVSSEVIAQNVGIGNTNPQYRLDLSNRMRIRGGADNNNSAGIWLGGTGTDSAYEKIFMGMKTDSSVGYYSNKSGVGWGFLFDGRNGNVGLGNQNPELPLSFADLVGDKISFYRDNNGNPYGFGIGTASMQLITPHVNSDVVFGYGRSSNFTENMRVFGNGNLLVGSGNASLAGLTVNKKVGAVHAVFGSNTTGVVIESSFPGIGFNTYYDGINRKALATGYGGYIGVNPISGGLVLGVSPDSKTQGLAINTPTGISIKPDGSVGIGVDDPFHKLDVGGRMRIRATTGFSAGTWLNNEANTVSPAFVGMQSDNLVGFYGNGAGWGLSMNTQNGALNIAGSSGTAGQVLTSNGSGTAPSWQTKPGNSLNVARQNNISASINSGRTDVPGMAANFTLANAAQVLFDFKILLKNNSCFACGQQKTLIGLVQIIPGNTIDITYVMVYTPNGDNASATSGPIVLDLAPGTYSYKVVIVPTPVTTASVYAEQGGILTWQIFYQ